MADPAKILKQVEFYFSDSNVVGDKYLKQQIGQHPDGFVAISVLATFNKLKNMSNDGDIATIASALEKSDELALDETKKMVKRLKPIPETYDPVPTSIYAKNVPTDAKTEDIQEFFEKFGKVRMVKRRFHLPPKGSKDKKRDLKPSVFVEFATKEECEKVLADPPTWEGQEKMEVMMRADHVEFDNRKKPKKDAAKEPAKEENKQDGEEGEGEAEAVEEDAEPEIRPIPEGCVLKITTELDEKTFWRDIKNVIQEGAVLPRSVNKQEEEGWFAVICNSKEDAETISKADLKLQDKKLQFETLTGDAEKAVGDAALETFKKFNQKGGRGGGRGGRGQKRSFSGGRGRGGRGRGRGRAKRGRH